MMKNALFLLFFALLPALACSQSTSPFPNNFNKARLGYATSGAGLVHTTDSLPDYTPVDRNAPVLHMDSTAGILYFWKGGVWNATAGADGNGMFSVGNNGDTVRINIAVVPNGPGFALRDVTSDVVFAVNDNSVTATAGDASIQAVKSLGYLLLQGDSLVIQINGSTGLPGQTIIPTGDGGAFWGYPVDATEANNGVSMSGDTVQLGGTLTKNTEVDLNGKTLRFRDAAGYPDLFMNGTYGLFGSDANTYLDVGSTAGRARIVAATTAQLTSAANTDVSATDTVTITGQRIRLNAVDTRIQQVSKSNTLNRVMMIDSTTEQIYYRDVSSIAGGGGSGTVTGTGTTGTIPVWSSSSALGDSPLTVSSGSVIAGGTGFFRFPVGTTAQRPGTPQPGDARYSSTNGVWEWYGASAWEVPVASASATGMGTANRLARFDANGRVASDYPSRFDPTIDLISIGSAASSVTGQYNVFLGVNTGRVTSTGFSNNFFGRDCGYNNTSGRENNFFGSQAGYNNTSGLGNNFFGTNAGFDNISGVANNFFGAGAGRSNTTGSYNSAFNEGAGFFNRIGSYNNFFGFNSGASVRSGSYNNFFGAEAAYNPTNADSLSGSYNIAIGYRVANNIAAAASRNVAIGNDIDLPTGNGSDQLVISNLIFGTGANGTGASIPAGGKVGIKTNAPAQDFHVQGTARITGSDGTGTHIMLRDADGDISNATLGSGLSLTSGTLTATGTGGTVTGSGTAGKLTKFTTSTEIGNSLLTESSSTVSIDDGDPFSAKILKVDAMTSGTRPTVENGTMLYNATTHQGEMGTVSGYRQTTLPEVGAGRRVYSDGTIWTHYTQAYGEMSIFGSSTITFLSSSTTFDTLSGFTLGEAQDFVMQGSALKYTGTRTIKVQVTASLTATFDEDTYMEVGLRQNSTSLTKSRARAHVYIPAEAENIVVTGILTLAPNDLIRIEMAPGSHTDDSVITVTRANINITEI